MTLHSRFDLSVFGHLWAPQACLLKHRLEPRLGASLFGTTTKATSDPAWHRRDRKRRGEARLLLRALQARDLLASHHSANMPKGKGKSGKDTYFVCSKSCGWTWASKMSCRVCGLAAPPWVRKLQEPDKPGTSSTSGATDDKETEAADLLAVRKVKKLVLVQKSIGEWAPQAVQQALDEALEEAKVELRQATPVATRLKKIQEGVERKQQALSALEEKRKTVLQDRAQLGEQLNCELESVKKRFADKDTELGGKLLEMDKQRKTLEQEFEQMRAEAAATAAATAAAPWAFGAIGSHARFPPCC
eukprot:2991367-Amphidinium_carterae.1